MVDRGDDRLERPAVVEPDAETHHGAGTNRFHDDSDSGAGRRAHCHSLGSHDLAVCDVREAEEVSDVLVERVRPELVRRCYLRDAAGALGLALADVDPNRPATISAHGSGLKASTAAGETLTGPAIDSVNTFEAPK